MHTTICTQTHDNIIHKHTCNNIDNIYQPSRYGYIIKMLVGALLGSLVTVHENSYFTFESH